MEVGECVSRDWKAVGPLVAKVAEGCEERKDVAGNYFAGKENPGLLFGDHEQTSPKRI